MSEPNDEYDHTQQDEARREQVCADLQHAPWRQVTVVGQGVIMRCLCGKEAYETVPFTPQDMIDSADALVWAREFIAHATLNPSIATDEGTMVGWFANALEAGRRAA